MNKRISLTEKPTFLRCTLRIKKFKKKRSQAGYFYDQKELIISGWPWFSKPNMGRTRREASSKIRSHKYSGKGEGKEKEKDTIKLDTLIQPGRAVPYHYARSGGKP